MKYKLCWISKNQEKKAKNFKTLEDIKRLMSHCIHSGEWVEDTKGKKVEMSWKEICFQNLSLF